MSSEREVAIVTGGTRGIGRAIALELVRAGCDLVVTYRSDEAAAEAARREIEGVGGRVVTLRSDAAVAGKAARVVVAARERLGPPRILVNNTGILRDRALYAMSEEEWDAVLDTNLKGAFNLCRAAAGPMMKQGYGPIVNISSVSALHGLPGQANYAASKAGLVGLTRVLAREAGRFGVTVNAVAPGFIEGEMLETVPQKQRRAALDRIPCHRFGTPAEVALLLRCLASEQAGYISGQVFAPKTPGARHRPGRGEPRLPGRDPARRGAAWRLDAGGRRRVPGDGRPLRQRQV